jgi:hypothetical protein
METQDIETVWHAWQQYTAKHEPQVRAAPATAQCSLAHAPTLVVDVLDAFGAITARSSNAAQHACACTPRQAATGLSVISDVHNYTDSTPAAQQRCCYSYTNTSSRRWDRPHSADLAPLLPAFQPCVPARPTAQPAQLKGFIPKYNAAARGCSIRQLEQEYASGKGEMHCHNHAPVATMRLPPSMQVLLTL